MKKRSWRYWALGGLAGLSGGLAADLADWIVGERRELVRVVVLMTVTGSLVGLLEWWSIRRARTRDTA